MEGARPCTTAGADGVMHQLDLDGLQRKNASLQRDLEAAERHGRELESEVGFLQTKVKEIELERVANLAKMLDDSGTDQNYNGLLKETLEEAETLRTEAETLRKKEAQQGRELERKKQEGEHLKRRIDTLEAANASLEDRLQSAEEKMSVELQKTAEEFSGREAALQHEVEVAKLSAATVSSQIQTLETEMLRFRAHYPSPQAVRAKHSPELLRKRDISGSPIFGSPHATPKRKLARSTNSGITRADRSSTLVSHTASSSTSTSSSTTKNKFPANKRSEPPYSDDEEARFSVDQSVELSKPQQQLLRGILKRDVSSPNLHADMPMGRAKTTKRSRALDIDAVSEMIISSHATTEPQRSLSRTSGTARMGKGLGMQANSASPSGAGDWKVRKALSTIEDLRTNLEKVTSQYDRERERGDKLKKRIQAMGRKAEKCIAGAAAACGNVGGN
eukprot:g19882.t1